MRNRGAGLVAHPPVRALAEPLGMKNHFFPGRRHARGFHIALLLACLAGACRCPTRRDPIVTTAPSVACATPAPQGEPILVQDGASLIQALAGGARHVRLQGHITSALTVSSSGTSDAPVVVDLAGAVLEAPLVVDHAEHVVIQGASFLSDGSWSWLQVRDAAGLAIVHNAFDVTCFSCGDTFAGLDLERVRDVTLCGNAFGSWIGDEVWIRHAARVLVEQNDFGRAQGEHALLSFLGEDLVVRRNVFRNPWDRVLHVASLEPDVVTRRAVIEENVFLHSDWDRELTRPVDDTAQDGGGALEAVRLIGVDHIFRGNLVVGTREGNQADCHGGVVLSTFATGEWVNHQLRGHRVYNNVFLGNDKVGLGIVDHLDLDQIDDNLVVANVFSANRQASIGLCTGDLSPDDVQVSGNLFDEGEGILLPAPDGGGVVVPPEAATAIAHDNATAPVSFSDPGRLEDIVANGELRLDLLEVLFGALHLESAPESPALTSVVEVRGDRTIVVADARFFSDGRGVGLADAVWIGPTRALIESIDGQEIVLAEPTDAAAGDPVRWSEAIGALVPP